MHVAFAAAEVMTQCLRLAMWATPEREQACPVTGLGGYSALALSTWSGTGLDGVPDTWMLMDGAWVGGSAGEDRDGLDLGSVPVGPPQPVFHEEGLPRVKGPDVGVQTAPHVIGVDARAPAVTQFAFQGSAGEVEPGLVEVVAHLVGPRHPDQHGRCISNQAKAPLTLS